MGIQSEKVRASGQLASEEEAKVELEKMDEPMEVEIPEERERHFQTPGFSRMRMDWQGDDSMIVRRAVEVVDGRILRNFQDAYEILEQVYDLVRTPAADPETGEILKTQHGYTVWRKTPSGSYEEDWSRLTHHEKERFLFTITTRLFDWEQRAADAWMEAMFAKAQFEEKFSIAFDAPMRGTVDDRRAKGNIDARDERYFAIFLTAYSRKADALVRTLNLLGQRIRDSL